ncbi:AAA-domain-containing protein [Punctularia strigosozonata HHB-11173 SS5]|uniref:AAA-domain-containing protein n=1 Tax=Punctularia strigosozonata (strain HHB-11173) TaxID=741275 RepID=R7S174_PUNST|nr:AAA-domain-containing protein [Punctularia strigosozonata HHB-11173 SS5]EIN03973.1 AAA-domain-containing protein [Punctularia strigosozonata HHB-11173 SS5]
MQTPGPHALNRSMQNLWSTHRRSKVNLNTPPTPGTPQDEVLPLTNPTNGEQNQERAEGTSTDVQAKTEEPPAPITSTAPSSTKRKVRTRTATSDDPNKRAKLSSSSASNAKSSDKDHSPPTTRLSDLGGVGDAVEKMLELVAMPLCHPEIYLHTGVHPPRGVLLHGPPGCGKTLLANAIAGELGVPFISISAPSIVSGMSGESEKTLRDTFDEAKKLAPCLLFIDEIDAVTPKRESAQREMERRIVAQFLTCMDDMSWDKTDNKPVVVIGATNRPDSLDAALRRAGRFDHEISMGVPDEEARTQILRVLSSKLRLEGSFDFSALAKATPGYVGADLAALTGAAGIVAVKRIFQQLSEGTLVLPEAAIAAFTNGAEDESMNVDRDQDISGHATSIPLVGQEPATEEPPRPAPAPSAARPAPSGKHIPFANLSLPLPSPGSSILSFLQAHPDPLTEAQLAPLSITLADFQEALTQVQPSSKREGFATVPDVTWSDVGALHQTREELHMAIVQPIRRPELFKAVGIEAACGVLMWGPPGCGKTLLAKAVANESRANFISVKGPELLNKYVGESERAVRQVFSRARASSPCIIFFDELDALVPRRDDSLSESSARVVNTLLTELDGLDARKSVYVIAATNRPDMIDPAMCRPGRLDKLLYVDLPSEEERAEIFSAVARKLPLGDGVRDECLMMVKEECDGYSGADLTALVREAGVVALRRTLGTFDQMETSGASVSSPPGEIHVLVTAEDFRTALDKVQPSVSAAQRRRYQALRSKFAGLPVRIGKEEEDKRVDGAAVSSG